MAIEFIFYFHVLLKSNCYPLPIILQSAHKIWKQIRQSIRSNFEFHTQNWLWKTASTLLVVQSMGWMYFGMIGVQVNDESLSSVPVLLSALGHSSLPLHGAALLRSKSSTPNFGFSNFYISDFFFENRKIFVRMFRAYMHKFQYDRSRGVHFGTIIRSSKVCWIIPREANFLHNMT